MVALEVVVVAVVEAGKYAGCGFGNLDSRFGGFQLNSDPTLRTSLIPHPSSYVPTNFHHHHHDDDDNYDVEYVYLLTLNPKAETLKPKRAQKHRGLRPICHSPGPRAGLGQR